MTSPLWFSADMMNLWLYRIFVLIYYKRVISRCFTLKPFNLQLKDWHRLGAALREGPFTLTYLTFNAAQAIHCQTSIRDLTRTHRIYTVLVAQTASAKGLSTTGCCFKRGACYSDWCAAQMQQKSLIETPFELHWMAHWAQLLLQQVAPRIQD